MESLPHFIFIFEQTRSSTDEHHRIQNIYLVGLSKRPSILGNVGDPSSCTKRNQPGQEPGSLFIHDPTNSNPCWKKLVNLK